MSFLDDPFIMSLHVTLHGKLTNISSDIQGSSPLWPPWSVVCMPWRMGSVFSCAKRRSAKNDVILSVLGSISHNTHWLKAQIHWHRDLSTKHVGGHSNNTGQFFGTFLNLNDPLLYFIHIFVPISTSLNLLAENLPVEEIDPRSRK